MSTYRSSIIIHLLVFSKMKIRYVLFTFWGLLSSFLIIQAMTPEGGEQWIAGQMYDIIWEANVFPYGTVDISLWNATTQQWYFVAHNMSTAAGKFHWSIPKNLSGNNFRMKIQSRKEQAIYIMSTAFFTIIDPTESGGNGDAGNISPGGTVWLVPNPAYENVRISWQGDAIEIKILDIVGRTIKKFPAPSLSDTLLSIKDFLNGVYFIEIRLRNGDVLYERLLIEH
jgi:hypothetical protein